MDMMGKYKITTKLRDGIKDIEGETIEQKLKHDGWSVKAVSYTHLTLPTILLV